MLDRLITGAGGLAAAADRGVRAALPGPRTADRPVGLVVAAALAALGLLLVVVASESRLDAQPRALHVADIDPAALGPRRSHATVAGGLSTYFVEMFQDLDLDGTWDEDEPVVGWDYFLVDPDGLRGIVVVSDRHPSEVLRLSISGYVVEDASMVSDDLAYFSETIDTLGLTLDETHYIDATASGAGTPLDLSLDLPRGGTPVLVDAARSPDYLVTCSTDPDGDGVCDDDEIDRWELIAYDPVSKRAVTVLTDESPEFAPVEFTGVVRRDAPEVFLASGTPGILPDLLGFTVEPILILDEGAPAPGGLAILVVAAATTLALAVLMVLGVVSGYVRFRPGGSLPAPVAGLAVGERRPLRVTGRLQSRDGLVRVREGAADLVRFPLAPPDAAGMTPSTLIVEVPDQGRGVALGRGESGDIEPGTVRSLRWTRPALRTTAGTGTIVLTFATDAERDAVAAALRAEAEPRSEQEE